jgi:multisubunit Na+/H+ antiporter MnhE subunit
VRLFLLNLALALVWTFLATSPSLTSFCVGFVLGFALVAAAERLFPGSTYVRRMFAFARFVAAFAVEFLSSNLVLARAVLFQRRSEMAPNFLTYDVGGLTRWEVLVLSHCITLTPGSTTVDVVDDGRTLLLHAFDCRDPVAVRRGIDRRLREPLLRWTR